MYGLVAAGEERPPCAELAYSHDDPTMTSDAELHIVILPEVEASAHGIAKKAIRSI